MYLVFDVETTGLPRSYHAQVSDLANWPRVVQLAWQRHSAQGALEEAHNFLIRPDGYEIPKEAYNIHGITTERAKKEGTPLADVLAAFSRSVAASTHLVGHNLSFDMPIVRAEYLRAKLSDPLAAGLAEVDTMVLSTDYMNLPSKRGGKGPRYPSLEELYSRLFRASIQRAHDASYDVEATARCLFELARQGIIAAERLAADTDKASIAYEAPSFVQPLENETATQAPADKKEAPLPDGVPPYVHLHTYTQFSVLPGVMRPEELVAVAKKDNMPAVAMTDFASMHGVFHFVQSARAAKLKPIIGLTCLVSDSPEQKRFTREAPDKRTFQTLLAKNKQGYQNLMRLSSIAYCEGLYGLYPRVSRAWIDAHAEGLIALSGGAQGEIGTAWLREDKTQAEKALQWWHKRFGDDFYLELYRHGGEKEKELNATFSAWAKQYAIKLVAAHEVYYAEAHDSDIQDTLMCIRAGSLKSSPVAEGRGKPIQLIPHVYAWTSSAHMYQRFADLPHAYAETQRIANKIEEYELEAESVSLPVFQVPKGYDSPYTYLKHLAFEGAKARYSDPLPAEIEERLSFELSVIEKSGYASYFLIVEDIIGQAHKMGMATGPGRGSAAGSVVAYALGITALDPIAYGLLFERFLNPERTSLPDIDIDFQDEGRDALLQWVVERYGTDRVAQIATYGTLAMKSALRDCARVMELPLGETNELVSWLPRRAKSLQEAYSQEARLGTLVQEEHLKGRVLRQARRIEGAIRTIGTHACGVIISPEPLTKRVPIARSKDAELPITQYDNAVVEKVGLLKMDLLGLRTLSILQRAKQHIQERYQKTIEWNQISLNDDKTYALYQRGDTYGIFQFESPGMQRYLKELKPNKFEDIIAMNALYRPGPMDYIPSFVRRRHGQEPIKYDLPEMETYLRSTYGITVYQEQVMLLSQALAGFTGGMADTLRKAMGKKDRALLDQLKPQFMKGLSARKHPARVGEKIWRDWEDFAMYAFNKSHAACYALLSYWTAYLKAHYPAEYMASVLTYNLQSTDRLSSTIAECQRMKIAVQLPCINASEVGFRVMDSGAIRFGLAAIKGIGEALSEALCAERTRNGPYTHLADLATRMEHKNISKGAWESLAKSGALDELDSYHRRQYLEDGTQSPAIIKQLVGRSGTNGHVRNQSHLFLTGKQKNIPQVQWSITPPDLNPYEDIQKSEMEKEIIGAYLSTHPLDSLRDFLAKLDPMRVLEDEAEKSLDRTYCFGGMLVDVQDRHTKKGTPYTSLKVDGLSLTHHFVLWKEDTKRLAHHLKPNALLCIEGRFQSIGTRTRFRVMDIHPLVQRLRKYTRALILHLSVEHIHTQWISQLEQILKRTPTGQTPLWLSISDKQTPEPIHMQCHKYPLDLDPRLITELQELADTRLSFEWN